MPTTKIAVSIDENIIHQIDQMVNNKIFPNRSKAFQEALIEKINRIEKSRLARECSKLNPDFEQQLAEEGLSGDLVEWPEY